MNTVANCEKTYTVKQLQALLKERDLPVSGAKPVLCKRLIDYERKQKSLPRELIAEPSKQAISETNIEKFFSNDLVADLKKKLSKVGLLTTGTKAVLKARLAYYLAEVCGQFNRADIEGKSNYLNLSNAGTKDELCYKLLEYFFSNYDDIYIPESVKREPEEKIEEPNEQPIIIHNNEFVESKGKRKVVNVDQKYHKLPKSNSGYSAGLQSLHWMGEYFFAEEDYENPQFEKYRLTPEEAAVIGRALLDSIPEDLLSKISDIYIYPNSKIVEIFIENVKDEKEAIDLMNELHNELVEGFGEQGYAVTRDDEIYDIMIE